MNVLMTAGTRPEPTMSSKEIAELVEKRHDKVKQSMERLLERGVIKLTPMGEVNHLGQTVTVYHVNERDSYVVVAQLSPEFTARLVDEWQRLKSIHNDPMTQLANAVLLSQRVIAQKDEQLAEMKRTKAHITAGREGTLFSKVGRLTKENNDLKQKMGIDENWMSAKSIPWLRHFFNFRNPGTWTVIGQQLRKIAVEMGIHPRKIEDLNYGSVNSYHVSVIDKFRDRLMEDIFYCSGYRNFN